MNLLLDTHLLIWSADNSASLSKIARQLMEDEENTLYFSVISIWEVAIKYSLGQAGFALDPRSLRRGLLSNGYSELAFTSEHALAVSSLPLHHCDPFDRALIAQAMSEGLIFLTADKGLQGYASIVRKV